MDHHFVIIFFIGAGIFFFLLELPSILKKMSGNKVKIAQAERDTAQANLETERLKAGQRLEQ